MKYPSSRWWIFCLFWFDTGVAHAGKRCSEHELAVGWNNKGKEFYIFQWIEKKIICPPAINCERIISGGYSALVATKTRASLLFFSCARRVKVGGWHEYISGWSGVVPCCLRKRGAGGSRSGNRDCERPASITLTLDYTPFLDEYALTVSPLTFINVAALIASAAYETLLGALRDGLTLGEFSNMVAPISCRQGDKPLLDRFLL